MKKKSRSTPLTYEQKERILQQACSVDDLVAIFHEMVSLAKDGDIAAAKFVFSIYFGNTPLLEEANTLAEAKEITERYMRKNGIDVSDVIRSPDRPN